MDYLYPLNKCHVLAKDRVEITFKLSDFMCLKICLLQLRLLSHRGGDELLLQKHCLAHKASGNNS